ncbi:MAG: BTAD domain-containing putative transcriptional regulator, partial [Ktedonobacteraceae bacterium]
SICYAWFLSPHLFHGEYFCSSWYCDQMNTTEQLHIYLFGSFRLVRNGVEVTSKDWHTRQARQLFKVLLTERGRLVPTRKLVDLLWPEHVEHAHKALRSAMSALRDVLEPGREPWLSSSFVPRGQAGYALVFPPTCTVWIDASEFERLLDVSLAGANTPQMCSLLENALRLYTGEYLAEDGESCWVLAERARLRERYFAGVGRLMQWRGESGCYTEAFELGQRALELDACREPLYRLIMQYQALAGDNAAALQTFEQCRQALAAHLGTDPSPQTLALHMAILKGEFPVHDELVEDAALHLLQDEHQNDVGWLARRLLETQAQALRYTMQAADYARRTFSYRQALADYDAASHLLQVQVAQHSGAENQQAEWWGRLYHGRGLVYEALLDWPGIQESHQGVSNWAALKQDPFLVNSSAQRMIVSRSLMGYVAEALGMGRELIRQLQQESKKLPTLSPQTRESLRWQADLARRWEQILTLDDPEDVHLVPGLPFPPFHVAIAPVVPDWMQAIEILGPSQAAFILTFYGWTLLLQGLNADAECCLQAALRAAEATGQVTWRILASLNLSTNYYVFGQHELREREFARCLQLCQQVPEAAWVTIWPLLSQAYFIMSVGQLDEAERIFLRVQEQLASQDLPAYRCSTQIGLGLVALARRQFEHAKHLLYTALAQRQSIYIEVYVLAEIGLAEIAQQQGAYAEAYERLYRLLAFSGRRSLLQFYAMSAFALARLSFRTQQTTGVAELLEVVSQLITAAGAMDMARKCRVLQAALVNML